MIRITSGKGFHLTLNGWTLSVQCGAGNYCDNYGNNIFKECTTQAGSMDIRSSTAEIAIWPEDGDMICLGGDTVAGHVRALAVGKIIGFLAESRRTEDQVRTFVLGVLQ